eukprot:GHVT01007241.1.p1 GENE.GHVT01007241.1~~GHVT01007241.1.p1  ORF type:complete len:166 (+),score=21.72 GHVT01007241.1:343-840(+)
MAVGFSPGPLLCNLCRSRGVRLAAARSNPNRYGVDVLNYPMLPSRRRMHTPVDRINMDMTAAEDPVPSHRRLVAGGHQPWLHSDLQQSLVPTAEAEEEVIGAHHRRTVEDALHHGNRINEEHLDGCCVPKAQPPIAHHRHFPEREITHMTVRGVKEEEKAKEETE